MTSPHLQPPSHVVWNRQDAPCPLTYGALGSIQGAGKAALGPVQMIETLTHAGRCHWASKGKTPPFRAGQLPGLEKAFKWFLKASL